MRKISFFTSKGNYALFEYERERHDCFMDDPNSYIGGKINNFILFLTIIFVFSLVLQTVGDYAHKYFIWFLMVDGIISTVFAGEYFYRLFHAKKKYRFITDFFNILDLLSFLPFFLEIYFGVGNSIRAVTVFRILRVFRLLNFIKKTPLVVQFIRGMGEYKNEYGAILSFTAILITIVSILVFYVEKGVNPDFSSIPNALWWALVTVTTVGYGDMYPITLYGKILGSILLISGPIIVTASASITVIIFMNISRLEKGDEVSLNEANKCWHCGESNLLAAKFCMHCGVTLEHKSKKHKFF